MKSTASIMGHPIHPILVAFPIGLWVFSLVSDFVFRATGDTLWSTIGFYTMLGGVIGALLAAVPGLVDLYTMPAGRSKRTGLWHMGINLGIVAIFAAELALRWNDPSLVLVSHLVLSCVGVALLLVSGWLGGEMIYRQGVAVEATALTEARSIPAEPVSRVERTRSEGTWMGQERRRAERRQRIAKAS